MKKILALMIGILLVASAVACAAGPSDSGKNGTNGMDPQPSTAADTEKPVDLYVRDLDGFTLSVANWQGSYSTKTLDVEYSEDISMIDEAIYRRNEKVKSIYNCDIIVEELADTTKTFNELVTSDDHSYDMYMVYEENLGNVLQNTLDWNELDKIDFENPWWNINSTKCFNIQGYQFAATGDYSLSQYSQIYLYVYNKLLYDDIGDGTNLYDLVRNGSWTVDKMFEISKPFNRDIDGDPNSVSDDDGHGIVATSKIQFSTMYAGMGGRLIENDEDGYPAVAMQSKYISLIDKMLTLCSNNGYFNNQPGQPNGSVDFSTYDKGNSLFFACLMKNASHLVDLDFASGFMPAPKLSEEQKSYYNVSVGENVSVLPRNLEASRQESVGIVLNAWAYYSSSDKDSVISKYRETYLKNRMADDLENDSEMIQIIFDGVCYDLGNSVWGKKLRLAIVKDVFEPLSTDYASVFASLVDTIKVEIDNAVEAIQF
ncbi:MAG: hypothetical protein J5563_00460 [Clostridia bacterium]|nr:hypothetical protein [Clostridia bacterium]